jgi:hypothetical protein
MKLLIQLLLCNALLKAKSLVISAAITLVLVFLFTSCDKFSRAEVKPFLTGKDSLVLIESSTEINNDTSIHSSVLNRKRETVYTVPEIVPSPGDESLLTIDTLVTVEEKPRYPVNPKTPVKKVVRKKTKSNKIKSLLKAETASKLVEINPVKKYPLDRQPTTKEQSLKWSKEHWREAKLLIDSDHQLALKHVEKARSLYDNPSIIYLQARCYALKGKWNDAENYAGLSAGKRGHWDISDNVRALKLQIKALKNINAKYPSREMKQRIQKKEMELGLHE